MEVGWVGERESLPFKGAKLGVLLNHTSLLEPIYIGLLPVGLLWEIAKKGIFPGADITMQHPIVGRLYRFVVFNAVSISRRWDETWKSFLENICSDSIILIAAEGRMKRPNGLDKHGNPMTVRGGIADVLNRVENGKMILVYSGGLHHVLSPGQKFPRLFKRIKVNMEVLEIAEYKKELGFSENSRGFRLAIVRDLENRRDQYCPGLVRGDEMSDSKPHAQAQCVN